MYNILLDRLPEDYKGWLIRTDYRIAMQIALALDDPDLSDNDRAWVSLSLLYGNGIPPVDIALEGLTWFMRCGDEREIESSGRRLMWWDFDASRLYSSFRQTYGIELHKVKLHWFEFAAMLDSLREDSALAHAVQIRGTDTSKMKGKEKHEYERLKRNLTPAPALSEEEKNAIEAFWAQFDQNGGD